MIFHAYRILFRRRLLAAAFITLLVPAFFVLIAANLCDCGADAVTNKLKIVLASLSIASLFLGVIFGVVLLYTAWASLSRITEAPTIGISDSLAIRLNLRGSYPTPDGNEEYVAQHVPAGFGIMFLAGTLSGLLGIGSGVVKVLAIQRR